MIRLRICARIAALAAAGALCAAPVSSIQFRPDSGPSEGEPLLALALYREFRDQPFEAMFAGALVILRRADEPRWPDTVEGVLRQRRHFASFSPGDPNSSVFPDPELRNPDWEAWQRCVAAAEAALALHRAGRLPPGPNHFHDESVRPSWHDPRKVTGKIGRMYFLEL